MARSLSTSSTDNENRYLGPRVQRAVTVSFCRGNSNMLLGGAKFLHVITRLHSVGVHKNGAVFTGSKGLTYKLTRLFGNTVAICGGRTDQCLPPVNVGSWGHR